MNKTEAGKLLERLRELLAVPLLHVAEDEIAAALRAARREGAKEMAPRLKKDAWSGLPGIWSAIIVERIEHHEQAIADQGEKPEASCPCRDLRN
jgi:hypothetical protein